MAFGLLVLFGGAPTLAQPLLPGLDELVGRGELKVGMISRDDAPMVMTGADGEATGYDVEIAKTIAAALGVKLTIVRTEPTFDGVIDQVARGDVDIAVSYLTRTVERAREVLFTRPYLTQSLTLLVSRVRAAQEGGKCPTPQEFVSELHSVPIGVEKQSSYAGQLAAIDPEATLRSFDSFADAMAALRSGAVAMTFQGEIVARRYLTDNPSMRVYALFCELSGWNENIAIAVNGNQAPLIPFLDVLLDQIHITVEGDTVSMTTDPWAY